MPSSEEQTHNPGMCSEQEPNWQPSCAQDDIVHQLSHWGWAPVDFKKNQSEIIKMKNISIPIKISMEKKTKRAYIIQQSDRDGT